MLSKSLTLAALLSVAAHADEKTAEAKPTETPAPTAEVSEVSKEEAKDPELAKAEKEQSRLATLNALAAEKQKHATSSLRAEIAKLKLEKELLVNSIMGRHFKPEISGDSWINLIAP